MMINSYRTATKIMKCVRPCTVSAADVCRRLKGKVAIVTASTEGDMANRPSQRQMEALVEFLERNPGIAKGLLRTHQAKLETKRKWQEFATAVNALGGVIKDGSAWSKYWAEKKCGLKRLCQQQAQSIRRTGGGTDTVPQLTLLELRLVAVMGGQSFATGDSGLAVDPFPHSSSQPSLSLQPSTSSQTAAAEVIALDFELVSEAEEPVQNPSQDVVETRPVEPSQVQSEPLHTARPRQERRQSRRRAPFLETEVARFEGIESRRVEAELQTAQALTDIATAIKEMVRLLSAVLERDIRNLDS